MLMMKPVDRIVAPRGLWITYAAVCCLCVMSGGCKMIDKVDSANEVVTTSVTTLETAQQAIEEVSKSVAATTPALETTMETIEQARLLIEQTGATINDVTSGISRTSETVREAERSIAAATKGINDVGSDISHTSKTVQEADRSIAVATKGINDAGNVIAHISETVQETDRSIAAATKGINDAGSVIVHISETVQETDRSVAAATKGINEIVASVERGTIAIDRLVLSIGQLQEILDRATAKRSLTGFFAAGAVLLVLMLAFLVWLWRFSRTLTVLAVRMDQVLSRPASTSQDIES